MRPDEADSQPIVVARDHTGHGAKHAGFDTNVFTGVTGVMAAVVSGHYGSADTTGQQ